MKKSGKKVFCLKVGVIRRGNHRVAQVFEAPLNSQTFYSDAMEGFHFSEVVVYICKTHRIRERVIQELYDNRQGQKPYRIRDINLWHGVTLVILDGHLHHRLIFDKKTRNIKLFKESRGNPVVEAFYARDSKPKKEREEFIKPKGTGFVGYSRHDGFFRLQLLEKGERSWNEVWIHNPDSLRRYRSEGVVTDIFIDSVHSGIAPLLHDYVHFHKLGKIVVDPYSILENNVGRVPVDIVGAEEDSDEVFFVFNDGGPVVKIYHCYDYGESVSINEVIGEPEDLIGYPLVVCDESDEEPTEEEKAQSDQLDRSTWTFYRFANHGGSLCLRWLGSSNGYYSEAVYIETLSNEQAAKEMP